MTVLHLFRVTLKTRGGLTVYAHQDGIGRPVMWTQDLKRAERWLWAGALEVMCTLRRANKPARLERCDETFAD